MRSIALFGGTFNPVHQGHLYFARACLEHFPFEELWLMPACLPPHKAAEDLASERDRLEMLRLGISGESRMRVSDVEYRLGGKSYTIYTLEQLSREEPDAEFTLLIGSDMLLSFDRWFRWEEILRYARLLAAAREEGDLPLLQKKRDSFGSLAGRITIAEIPVLPLSSTEVREAVRAGKDCRPLLPGAVADYIREKGLYRKKEDFYDQNRS